MESNTELNESRLANAWAELHNHAVNGNPLHADAYRLAFAHPVTGKVVEFHAPLPADLREAMGLWGLRYNDLEWLASHAP